MLDTLSTIAQLEALYGQPVEAATVKEVGRITPHYRAYIEASPFATLATARGRRGARRAATSRVSCAWPTRRP